MHVVWYFFIIIFIFFSWRKVIWKQGTIFLVKKKANAFHEAPFLPYRRNSWTFFFSLSSSFSSSCGEKNFFLTPSSSSSFTKSHNFVFNSLILVSWSWSSSTYHTCFGCFFFLSVFLCGCFDFMIEMMKNKKMLMMIEEENTQRVLHFNRDNFKSSFFSINFKSIQKALTDIHLFLKLFLRHKRWSQIISKFKSHFSIFTS